MDQVGFHWPKAAIHVNGRRFLMNLAFAQALDRDPMNFRFDSRVACELTCDSDEQLANIPGSLAAVATHPAGDHNHPGFTAS